MAAVVGVFLALTSHTRGNQVSPPHPTREVRAAVPKTTSPARQKLYVARTLAPRPDQRLMLCCNTSAKTKGRGWERVRRGAQDTYEVHRVIGWGVIRLRPNPIDVLRVCRHKGAPPPQVVARGGTSRMACHCVSAGTWNAGTCVVVDRT